MKTTNQIRRGGEIVRFRWLSTLLMCGVLVVLGACGASEEQFHLAKVPPPSDGAQVMIAAIQWMFDNELNGVERVALEENRTAAGPGQIELRATVASYHGLPVVDAEAIITCPEAPPTERPRCSFEEDLEVLMAVEQPEFDGPDIARIRVTSWRQWSTPGGERDFLGHESWLFEAVNHEGDWVIQPLERQM